MVLLVCLARRDFRIEYVAQYSGLELPWYYQLAAFWAGQKGSFLIWLAVGGAARHPALPSAGERDEAPVMGVYLLTLLGLLFILVRENPFVMLDHAPVDGDGLNPLLQDNWMVIHPPIMFVGYALAAIPFAFAVAALWRREPGRWAARAFPWALAGFLVLGTAILMGGYWAYKTLGWGGYWGWDPVENASLIPWIFGTVLIHGLHLERAKRRYRRANHVLACLVYLAVLYGTFLTRSGVLADFSVHSFVDLGISGWLVALMAFFVGSRRSSCSPPACARCPPARNEDPLLSRGTFMVLSTITLAGLRRRRCSSAPRRRCSPASSPTRARWGPSFYNRVNLPMALLVALPARAGALPHLAASNPPRQLLRRLALPAVGAAGGRRWRFAVWACAIRSTWCSSSSPRWRSPPTCRRRSLKCAGRRPGAAAGGYLAHVGVGVILLGILASSAYDAAPR